MNDIDIYGNYPDGSPSVVHQRKKLRSWLLERLDVNDCPGCSWLDNERKMFRLTWKHYGRPGFDEERVCDNLLKKSSYATRSFFRE